MQLSNRTPTWQTIENVCLQSPVSHPPEPLRDIVEQGDNGACFTQRSDTELETFKERTLQDIDTRLFPVLASSLYSYGCENSVQRSPTLLIKRTVVLQQQLECRAHTEFFTTHFYQEVLMDFPPPIDKILQNDNTVDLHFTFHL